MITAQALDVMQVKAYAGIGSRETPGDVLQLMTKLGGYLRRMGFRLRTGGATGADSAFELGADPLGRRDFCEVFLPWPGFNGHKGGTMLRPARRAFDLAAAHHPAWWGLSNAGRSFHARNVHQVLGEDLATPAAFVLCWTPDGATSETTSRTGGTGQAIRIAVSVGVPVFNLARPDHRGAWEALLG